MDFYCMDNQYNTVGITGNFMAHRKLAALVRLL
jgi:hypothetical protein